MPTATTRPGGTAAVATGAGGGELEPQLGRRANGAAQDLEVLGAGGERHRRAARAREQGAALREGSRRAGDAQAA